jgi:hypothetical protein
MRKFVNDAAAFPVTPENVQNRLLEYSVFGIGGGEGPLLEAYSGATHTSE